MNIAGLSMNMSMIDTKSQVGTAVLGKVMDSNELMGQNMVAMLDSAAMERSVNPAVGGNLDLRI